jgi:CIC family chloride channel protein
MTQIRPWLDNHPRLSKYAVLVRQDLKATYARDLHRWLLIGPILGVTSGLLITLVAEIILRWIWPPVLQYYLAHHLAMIPGLILGFSVAGLLMQWLTPDPDEHSTEEIIRSYHEHQGDVQMRPLVPKLLAAIATVGCGGSAALEGPSIYGGGAVGSWLWHKLRFLGLEPRDRRILLISGAAAGMSAVFRAPLTGIIFALEMPYKDDLAHEALLPSLIASVTSYATMAVFLGAEPLFHFSAGGSYNRVDLLWSALLGLGCGLLAMVFNRTFRRLRTFCVNSRYPHWAKMALGGALTGACGLAFLSLFPGRLVPIGPNYEAVPQILQQAHGSVTLLAFGLMKLIATLFSLAFGGVSAMFVPLFLTGGSFGIAFGQAIVHSPAVQLYAAVGMAALLAGGYKTPLAAVVFVAEATGGHGYIVPTLIGAAVAYAVSGETSVSGDQRLHEGVKIAELSKVTVREVMQRDAVSIEGKTTLRQFAHQIGARHAHSVYPVLDQGKLLGTISMSVLCRVAPEQWEQTPLSSVTDSQVVRVLPECDLREALRLLTMQRRMHMLLVTSEEGALEGILTKTDILSALNTRAARTDKLDHT